MVVLLFLSFVETNHLINPEIYMPFFRSVSTAIAKWRIIWNAKRITCLIAIGMSMVMFSMWSIGAFINDNSMWWIANGYCMKGINTKNKRTAQQNYMSQNKVCTCYWQVCGVMCIVLLSRRVWDPTQQKHISIETIKTINWSTANFYNFNCNTIFVDDCE